MESQMRTELLTALSPNYTPIVCEKLDKVAENTIDNQGIGKHHTLCFVRVLFAVGKTPPGHRHTQNNDAGLGGEEDQTTLGI